MPQELITVHRGGRSTTVFSDSNLAPPSSIPVQPYEGSATRKFEEPHQPHKQKNTQEQCSTI
uniref:Uncharacterized protein n=1 Tax=Oryza nivara TaxID=4536 RepID=A0A0E0I296_ORYNI